MRHQSTQSMLGRLNRAAAPAICAVMLILNACGPRLEPVSGAPGIGDPYYPQLGNGGYDVQKYDLVFEIEPETNDLTARETVEAQSTEFLKSLNLDLQGLTVDAVTVNGSAAGFEHHDHELTITPPAPIQSGAAFSIEISYHGRPGTADAITSPDWIGKVGWFHGADGSIMTLNEPNGAALWFAVNDHPRDKAAYRFDIRVPDPWVVVAPGTLRQSVKQDGHTRYIWEMRQPMASYLASLSVGRYAAETSQGPDGLRIRSYFAEDAPEGVQERAGVLPDMIRYFTSLFGPYPFDEYGVLLLGDSLCDMQDAAEEVQTMSLYCPHMFDEQLLGHELAHQWFGDSVSIRDWQDLWLKEGMATYAEWLWSTRDSGLEELNTVYIKTRLSRSYSMPTGQPKAGDLYSYREVYEGGALVFHALRLEVGDETFFRILRTYLADYRYGNAGTADFIAVAERVSGRDLKPLLEAWLMQAKPPVMPGSAGQTP